MTKNDCVFCKIISGEIRSEGKLYEDDCSFSFLSTGPNNFGHALVVPKGHYENIYEIPDDCVGEMMKTVKKVALAIKAATQADGINIGMNNEKAAGQAVFHAHIHIIPRYFNDGFTAWESDKKYKDGEMKDWAEKIISHI